jgi:Ca2+-dependent lipid-binding protein
MTKGIFELTIVSAEQLQQTSRLQKMDPYVQLFFLQEKVRTQTHKNGNVSPVWNEQFKCRIDDEEIEDQTIKIMIKNENRMMRDEIIGIAETSIGDCLRFGSDEVRCPVLDLKTRKQRGTVTVQMKFRSLEIPVTESIEKVIEKKVIEMTTQSNANNANNNNNNNKTFEKSISRSMENLVIAEETEAQKQPQYKPMPIKDCVCGPNEGWY